MTFEDIRVQVFYSATENCLHEVPKVVFAAFELADNLAVRPDCDAAGVAGTNQGAFGGIEDVAHEIVAALAFRIDVGGIRRIARQPAHFEDQLAVAEVEEANLRVGGFAVVDIAEAAADAE